MRELVVDVGEVLQRQGQCQADDAAGRIEVEFGEEGGVDCWFSLWFSKIFSPILVAEKSMKHSCVWSL